MTVLKSCEFVSPRDPDKICDFIADSILDALIRQDRKSRVAIQVLGGHNKMTITGEVTCRTRVDMARIARRTAGKDVPVDVNVAEQSPFIGQGVAKGGAGDQGIMMGYATAATKKPDAIRIRSRPKPVYGHIRSISKGREGPGDHQRAEDSCCGRQLS